MIEKQSKKPKQKPTDSERHKRFVDMAKEVEASEKKEDFDRAFCKVAKIPAPGARKSKPR